MVKAPIWKNTDLVVNANLSPLTYYITEVSGSTEEEIFRGKAYLKPQATGLTINVNKICQNYLSNAIATSGNTIPTGTNVNTEASKVFKVYNASGNTVLETYTFLYNWEYVNTISFNSNINLSRPINNLYAPGMKQLSSYWQYSNSSVYNSVATSGTYTTPGCGNWALYYLNRAGGWDSFLIEGKVKRTDEYDRHNMVSSPSTGIGFEKQNYTNQITRKYELNTSWLNDEQSHRLAFHLLSSNRVYLHDLVNDEIMPVVITNSNTEFKTFKNNRKLISYTINVEASQIQQNYA